MASGAKKSRLNKRLSFKREIRGDHDGRQGLAGIYISYSRRARGEARGKAEAILVVFEQRGIDVDERSRELIESCTDLDTLNGWFRRAFKVVKASDLFAE